jgi:uncharacterized protein (DUF58 family)
MSPTAWAGAALLALGALAGAPPLLLVGVLTLLAEALRSLWSRHGLRGVTYERRLGTDRAVWGDEIPLDVIVWNRKLLPLPWLHVDDFVSENVTVRERRLSRTDRPGLAALEHTWTLAWYERVVRHLHVVADHRGMFRFEGARIRVADLFARDTAEEENRDPLSFLVRPRTVPVRGAAPERAPIGERVAPWSLFRDPALFAGVRPYQPGDPMRHVHWKATARTGRPVVKRFDPSRSRELVVVLDVQTLEGPHWVMSYDEDLVEGLCVAAASLARRALAEGAECGLLAAAYTGTPQATAWVPPAGGAGQLARITDTIARLASFASAPFEHMIAAVPLRVGPGATVLAISARPPGPFLGSLRRLARSGYDIELVAMGPAAPEHAAGARAAGVRATVATLSPDWRTSDALVIGA